MKRFYTLLILFLGVLSSLMAADEYGTFYSLDKTNKTAKVSGTNCEKKVVEIPGSIIVEGVSYKITTIGWNAFRECKELTSITIGSNVTKIEAWAFNDCSNLESITIPNSLTTLEHTLFKGCSSLTKVNYLGTMEEWLKADIRIPTSFDLYLNGVLQTNVNISSTDSIRKDAFRNCKSIKSVEIAGSVTSIGLDAFLGCSALTSITIPNSVTFIDAGAFTNCSSLTKVNYLGSVDEWLDINFTYSNNNPTVYANDLYINGKLLTDVKISSADSIKDFAICYCKSIKSLEIGNSVAYIDKKAFSGCSGLTSVTWNIKNYPGFRIEYESPFDGLNITSFTFGNEVERVPAHICYGQESLKEVTIGTNVISIGNDAFNNCRNLNTIVSYPTAAPTAFNNSFKNYNATLYVPCDAYDNYSSDDVFGTFKVINCITAEEEGGTTPTPTPNPDPKPEPDPTPGGEITLYYVNNTNWATVYAYVWPTGGEGILAWPGAPATKTYMTVNGYDVYSYTFESTKADNIIFNNGSSGSGNQTSDLLIDIGKHYFYDGAWYASLNFDAEEGGTGEFDDGIVIINGICYELQSNNTAKVVYLRDKNGGRLDYSGNIEIPSTITYKEKTYSVTTIGANAFLDSELTEIEIPATITTMESDAFWGANDLTSINYLGKVDQWAEIEFADEHSNPMRSGATFYIKGEKLTTVSIEKASVVKQYAFTYNSSIISVKLGNSVIEIQKSAFEGTTNIERVEIGENISSIGNSAFRYINALSELTIHAVTVPTLASNWKPHDYIHLYVPCESLDLYKNALYFVYEIQCISNEGDGENPENPDTPEPEPDPDANVFVAGNGGSDATGIWCNGIEWSSVGVETANNMTDADKDGIYEITFNQVPAGTWNFKVVGATEGWMGSDYLDTENSSAGYTTAPYDGNIGFTLNAPADVTIKFNMLTGKIIVTTPSGSFGKVKIDYFSVANTDECLVENRFTAANNNTLKYTENIQILEGNEYGYAGYRILGNCNYAVYEKSLVAEVTESGMYEITIKFNGDYENPDFTVTAVKQGGTIDPTPDPDPVVAIKNLMIQPFEQVLPNTTTTTVATFTLQNANTATVSIEGLDADFFEIGEQNIGNGECSVSIVFKPIVIGVYYATLVVTTDDEVSLSIDFAAAAGDETFEPGDVPELNPDPVNPGTPDDEVSVEEVSAIMIYAKEGTIYSEVEFEIYDLAGVNVTKLNGSLEGVYIVKTAEGNRLISVW